MIVLFRVVCWPVARLFGWCSCDPRFLGVAADVACPKHGLVADLARTARFRRFVADLSHSMEDRAA